MSRIFAQEDFEVLPTNVREYYVWFKEFIEAHNLKEVTVRWVIPGFKFIVNDKVNNWVYSCSGRPFGTNTFQHPVLMGLLN